MKTWKNRQSNCSSWTLLKQLQVGEELLAEIVAEKRASRKFFAAAIHPTLHKLINLHYTHATPAVETDTSVLVSVATKSDAQT